MQGKVASAVGEGEGGNTVDGGGTGHVHTVDQPIGLNEIGAIRDQTVEGGISGVAVVVLPFGICYIPAHDTKAVARQNGNHHAVELHGE